MVANLATTKWKHQYKDKEIEAGKSGIRSAAWTEVIRLGGCCIKYPDIVIGESTLFLSDGVHLTPIGTSIFLSTLNGSLRNFITTIDAVYPKRW